MRSKTRAWLKILLLGAIPLLLSGCGSVQKALENAQQPVTPGGQKGSIVVKVSIPSLVGNQGVSAQARPNIAGVRVTAISGQTIIMRDATLTGSTATVSVDGLPVGKWNFTVGVIDIYDHVAYSGSKSNVQILPGPDASGVLEIALQPTKTQVFMYVDLTNLTYNEDPRYLWTNIGKVKVDLAVSSSNGSSRAYSAYATVSLDKRWARYGPTAFDAGTLIAQVTVYDPTNTIVLWQSDEVFLELHPGDEPHIEYIAGSMLNNGDIQLDTPVLLVPEAPTGVMAAYANGAITTTFSHSIDKDALETASAWWGYTVRYRLANDKGKPFATLIENNSPKMITASGQTFNINQDWRGKTVLIGLVPVADHGTDPAPMLVYGPMSEYVSVVVPAVDPEP